MGRAGRETAARLIIWGAAIAVEQGIPKRHPVTHALAGGSVFTFFWLGESSEFLGGSAGHSILVK